MRFEEAYVGWQAGRLTQEDATRLLGVCDRTFRRQNVAGKCRHLDFPSTSSGQACHNQKMETIHNE